MTEVEVYGIDDLIESMEGLTFLARKGIITRALRKGAEPIAADARRLAPDDPATPGSRVRDNVRVQVVDQTAESAEARVTVNPFNDIARFSELGTIHEPARPFLRPSFDGNVNEALELVANALGAEITKAWARRGVL